MSTSLLFAGALLAQVAAPVTVVGTDSDHIDVGYEQLAAGRNSEAVDHIRASRLDAKGDPAALINLGTAHARLGHRNAAMSYYQAAIATPERYDLQLADGSWMDSRRAARTAIRYLSTGNTLAMK